MSRRDSATLVKQNGVKASLRYSAFFGAKPSPWQPITVRCRYRLHSAQRYAVSSWHHHSHLHRHQKLPSRRGSPLSLKVLHRSFVLFGRLSRSKSPEVPSLSSLRILFPRIEPKL